MGSAIGVCVLKRPASVACLITAVTYLLIAFKSFCSMLKILFHLMSTAILWSIFMIFI